MMEDAPGPHPSRTGLIVALAGALLGTTFGGDGQTTFGLPDLRGRVIVGAGQGPGLQPYLPGEISGTESVSLNSSQFAGHTHALAAAETATTGTPSSSVALGTAEAATPMYASAGAATALAGSTVTSSPGSGGPHENRQPTTTVNYIISLNGVYPSRG